MSSETEGRQDQELLEKPVKEKVISLLGSVGYHENVAQTVLVSPVDQYHKNCFYLTLRGSARPEYVMKLLDPEKGWDVREDMIRHEHNVGEFVSRLVPELSPRLFTGWCSADEMTPAIVLYSYLGEAATHVKDSRLTLEILSSTLGPLIKMHTLTSSEYFGSAIDESERSLERYPQGFGLEIAKYLLNDIHREQLDPQKKIEIKIQDHWIPILNSEKKFCLTHKDITLSNIIHESGKMKALIDWTYSRWEDPAYDLAYVAFLSVIRNCDNEIQDRILKDLWRYNEVGLFPEKTFPFFLAYKCIEFGRFRGKGWVDLGENIMGTNSIEESMATIVAGIKKF